MTLLTCPTNGKTIQVCNNSQMPVNAQEADFPFHMIFKVEAEMDYENPHHRLKDKESCLRQRAGQDDGRQGFH